MTLTAPQINDIAVAIGMTPTLLNAHLVSLGTTLTLDKETKVLIQMMRYGTPGSVTRKFWLTPTESNEGSNTSPQADSENSRDPLTNIRLYLEIPEQYWPNTSGYASIPLCL